MYVDREKALEQGEKLNVVGGPAWRTGFPHETVCCHEGRGGHFCPEISRQACWRAKMPTPARRAAYCWVRKTSAECRATKYWRYFSIAKELSLSKYTSFPWFYWIRDFVTLQNTVFLIAKSGKEIKIFQNIRLSISAPKISSSWVCFWLSLASQGLENLIWSKQGLENWNYVFFSDFPIPVLLHKSKTGNGKLEWKTGLENWNGKLDWKTGILFL